MKKYLHDLLQKMILNVAMTKVYRQKGPRDCEIKDILWNIPKGIHNSKNNASAKTVVMIHRRNNPYLKHTIAQARKVLKNANFVLIGDDSNKYIAEDLNMDFYPATDFSEDLDYGYTNRSVNPEYYEKFCLDRWLIFRNFVKKMNLPGALYFDSDVLVLDDLILDVMCDPKYDLVKQKEELDFTWPCAIYWSKAGINMFIRYIKLLYSQSADTKLAILDEIKKRFRKGGVSDMTLISDFCLEKSTVKQFVPDFGKYCNLDELNIKQIEYDKPVRFGNEVILLNSRFQTTLCKRVVFNDGMFLCKGARLLYLHFQGSNKSVFARVLKQVQDKKSFIVTRDFYEGRKLYTLYSPIIQSPILNRITDSVIRWKFSK